MSFTPIEIWLERCIEQLEALPPTPVRARSVEILREHLSKYRAASGFAAKLLEPQTPSDWLDRRHGLERAQRYAEGFAAARERLRRNDRRFRDEH